MAGAMLRPLRFALLAAVAAAALAPSAQATRVLGLPETMTTPHFQLHYDGGVEEPATPVTHQQAGDLATSLERAYHTVTGEWGYPAPLPDGDGLIDVYVTDLTPLEVLGLAFSEGSGTQRPGYLLIDDDATGMPFLAMHELFHLVQVGIWQPMSPWLLEGTAEWAGFRFMGFPSSIDLGGSAPVPLEETLGAPDMSLSCSGAACGLTDYERGGYSRWHFYEYLAQRFGSRVVLDVFQKGAALATPSLPAETILHEALRDRGSTLADAFTDWTVANMGGVYTAPTLRNVVPPTHTTVPTGVASGSLPTVRAGVNHLAARYVGFTRGGSTSGRCHPATLRIDVALPFGLGSRPYFRWTGAAGPALPLAVSGGTASITLPWDTCNWSGVGLLSLPNPSTSVDAALFTVTGSIAVDKTKLTTSTPPPPGSYTGPTVPAPDAEEPPSIALYGPETLRVSRKTRVVRLVVFASGGGALEAQLGSLVLGTRALRAGNNDLRFVLPASAVGRKLASTALLSVTSVGAAGGRGETVTRKLLLTK